MAMDASWMFLYEAYRQLGVSMASLLYYCGPVIVMVFSPLIFKEKLTAPKICGFLIVIAGIVLVNGKTIFNGTNSIGMVYGGMLAVMNLILNKKSESITGMENSVIQLAASFLTVAVYVGIRQHFVINVLPSGWPWIILLGVVNTGIGCYLYFSTTTFLDE